MEWLVVIAGLLGLTLMVLAVAFLIDLVERPQSDFRTGGKRPKQPRT